MTFAVRGCVGEAQKKKKSVKIDFQSHQGDLCVGNAHDLLCCTWRFEVLNIMD